MSGGIVRNEGGGRAGEGTHVDEREIKYGNKEEEEEKKEGGGDSRKREEGVVEREGEIEGKGITKEGDEEKEGEKGEGSMQHSFDSSSSTPPPPLAPSLSPILEQQSPYSRSPASTPVAPLQLPPIDPSDEQNGGHRILNPAKLIRRDSVGSSGGSGDVHMKDTANSCTPSPTQPQLSFLTGLLSHRCAQQSLHQHIQKRDVHGAAKLLPQALGTAGLGREKGESAPKPHPENIQTVLQILATSAPTQGFDLQNLALVTHLLREVTLLVREVFRLTGSNSGDGTDEASPDPFTSLHPLYGNWSALPSANLPSNLVHLGKPHSTSAQYNNLLTTATQGYLHTLFQQTLHLSLSGHYTPALTASSHLLHLNRQDDFGVRFRIPIYMLKLNMPLQAVRFCLAWLEDTTPTSTPTANNSSSSGFWDRKRSWDENWEQEAVVGVIENSRGKVGGVDLSLDMVQGRYQRGAFAMPGMAFLVALGCWRMWKAAGGGLPGGGGGVGGKAQACCLYARSWLRLAHKANKHVLRILLSSIMLPGKYIGPTGYMSTRGGGRAPLIIAGPSPTPSTTANPSSGNPNTGKNNNGGNSNRPKDLVGTNTGMDTYEEANDFLFTTQGLFTESDEVKQWLYDTMFSVVANTCLGCGKKETRVGEHRACLSCHSEWYCGLECQNRAWGGHKRRCVEIRKGRKLREMGTGLVRPLGELLSKCIIDLDASSSREKRAIYRGCQHGVRGTKMGKPEA
ncbi:hypothetical protein DFH27DRAFT_642841 [Peziza echinospora]|nr:hypothetical protein DFH27DRAFT_642841 [Peziza echinospora]